MIYDPTSMANWEISRAAEENMPTPYEWGKRLGLTEEEMIAIGRLGKLSFLKIMDRLQNKPDGKYVDVTGMTPTPLGEGKTTTALGLIQGLARLGKNPGGCVRQASGGPTMNMKGTAAGSGNALLIPMDELSMGLTGDMNDVTNAHNLAMVAVTARMQHERNYSDDELLRRSGMPRLGIDPSRVQFGWVMDFCAQSLRNIVIGMGGRLDGFMMSSKFNISASSELMAILSIAQDLPDLRKRISEITVAFDKQGQPVTTADLEVDGAMCAWMRNAIDPTLCCTADYQPCLVHTGPFANIAIGQSSIIGDRLGLKLFDYHVTESGFGSEIGFEKFWNVKCRISGLVPDAVVLTVTIRALKLHGGGPPVIPGSTLPDEYTSQDLDLVERGLPNLLHHVAIIRKSGVNPVVCLNRFHSDTDEEVKLVRNAVEGFHARFAPSDHWARGGEGAIELAELVVEAAEEKKEFRFLYPSTMKLKKRVEVIAREVYGAEGVRWTPEARAKADRLESNERFDNFATIMVKTPLSLSHDPARKGVPKDWVLPIRDILVYTGARFLCPCAGDIKLMPGTSSNPAYRRVDVDVETGRATGLV